MEEKRARQIFESHGVIEVLYHDAHVWIEEIKDEQRATVTILDTAERLDVPIDQLVEISF